MISLPWFFRNVCQFDAERAKVFGIRFAPNDYAQHLQVPMAPNYAEPQVGFRTGAISGRRQKKLSAYANAPENHL